MSGQVVVVDTNVFISARNRRERAFAVCRHILDQVDSGSLRAIVSTVTIAELRAGLSPEEIPTTWRAMLTHLLTSPNYRVEPVDAEISEAAGEIRAEANVSLPDALILATGKLRGAAFLVTQDKDLAKQQIALAVKIPQDVG
ncbi:MAG: type II toxin-antitoxin system VapC family toxin [Thermoplasmata archaeon]